MTLHKKLSGGLHALLRAVFPPRCIGCKTYVPKEALACERCRHAIFTIDSPLCLVCGEPRQRLGAGYGGVDEICGRCLEQRPHFERARSYWEYTGTIAEALQRAKYGGELWELRSLACALRPWLAGQFEAGIDTLFTVVPMHPSDLRRRGFNAALLLFQRALPRRRVRTDLVIKTKKTPAQAGLARGQRLHNVKGAFACKHPAQLEQKHVVLFDDVMTTGATANEVAKALLKGGARSVQVVTAARTIAA